MKKVIVISFILSILLLSNISALGMNTYDVEMPKLTALENEKGNIVSFKMIFLFGRINSLNMTQDEDEFYIEMYAIKLTEISIEINRYGDKQFSFEIITWRHNIHSIMSFGGKDIKTRGIFKDNFICGFIIINYRDLYS